MNISTIAIIGGGNLGISIAEGLVQSGKVQAENICVTRRKLHLIEHLSQKGIKISSDNKTAAQNAQIVLVAVKPKQIKEVLSEIKPVLTENQLLISVVTGVTLSDIQAIIPKNLPLFRAMPNTAIAIQESMTCIATNNANEEQKNLIKYMFDLLGRAVFIDDDLMAAATVLGACGIAYAMRYIRASSQGGIEIGFGADVAQLIAAQTVKGAASLLLTRGLHPEKEIDKVTTPQGCTIVGLNEMEHRGFSSALIKGILASYYKIDKISEDYQQK